MANMIEIKINNANNTIANYQASAGAGAEGKTLKIPAQKQVNYQFVDSQTNAAPQKVSAKRVGKDLQVNFGDANAAPDLVIENYYDYPESNVVGQASNGTTAPYTTPTGESVGALGSSSTPVSLGGASISTPLWVGAASAAGGLSPWAIAAGVAGLAVAGAAAGGGGGGGGGSSSAAPTPAPSTPSATPNLSDSADSGSSNTDNITNNTQPGFAIAAPAAGQTANLYVDGVKVAATYDAATGEIKPNSPLPTGTHTITTSLSNSGGESAQSPALSITIDTTPPVPVTATVNDSNANGKPNANGTAEPNSTVVVTWPDGSTSTTTANASGTWSVEAANVMANGPVSVKATDTAGNVSTASASSYVDTTPPAAPSAISISDADANGKPTVSGSAEPGSTVTVTWPNGTTSTVLASATGSFSIESPTVQTGGPISVKATDLNGNTGSTTTTTYTDTTAPLAPTVTVNDANANGKPNASGTAEPGSTVTVTWPDGTTSTTVADASGSWAVESPTVQTSGTVSVKASDPAGNVSTATAAPYTDSTAPAAPAVGGISDPDANGKPTASGSAEPGSTVTVTWPNGSTSSVIAGPSGAWSIESPTVQTSGSVSVKATDVNGNTGPSTTTTYTDSTAPVAPTATINDSNANGKPNASGTAEPGSTVTVTWPDGTTSTATANPSGVWSVESPTVQANGPISVKATDSAGNTSLATTATYSDSTPPAAPTISLNDSDADGKPNASGSAEPGSTVTVTWPDGSTSTALVDASGNWAVESPTVQSNGTISAKATDKNGNTGLSTNAAYADTTAPIAPTTTVNDSDADGKPNASGTAEPGSTVTVTWPDGTTSTAVADSAGAWAVESPTVQTSGTITTKTTDAAGNVSATTTTPYTDNTAPAAPTTTVNDSDADGKPNASGTAEPGSTVTVTWPDGTTSTAVAGPSGTWAVESPTVQTSGTITTKATDAAGNVSATTTTAYSDNTAPIAPTTTVNDSDADGKPNASGTAEPGSTVTVTWPDGTTSTAVAGPSGNWAVESPTVQTSGTITTKATDSAGNVSAITTTPYTDSTAPIAPTTTVNDSDADGKPNASGTAEPGSTITVTWPDGTTSTATAGPSGAWSVESPTVQNSGTISTTAMDTAGNVSATTTTPYTDSTAPLAPTTTINDTDANGKPNASGTAEPGSTVTVTWPDGSTSTVVANASGAWAVESPTVQTSGTITTKATDAAGNVSATTTTPYTDSTAPLAPTLSINDGDTDGKPNASGTAEPGSTVTVTWPDGSTSTAVAGPSGAWAVESATVQTGGTITAKATDSAGNAGPVTSTAYTDSTAPIAPTLSINDADADGKPNASGTAEPGSTVTVTWPDGTTSTAVADSAGAWAVESPTVQTSGSITTKATDAAGNAGPVTSTTYTDSTAPTAPTTTVNDADADGKPNASGTAEPGSTVTVTWPDGTTSTAVADSAGAWAVESPTVQTSGSITTKATDAAGNVSATTTTPYTDSTAPAAPTTTVNDSDADGKPNASGTAEPGSTVTVTWPDGTTSTTTANASGNWSVESPTVQTSGTITTKATDAAGNVSATTTTPYTDSTAPAAPTTTVNDSDADGKPNASGTAEPGSTVTVTWPDGTTSTAVANSAGAWAVESPTVQTSGSITTKATDAAGNVSATTTTAYTDSTAPAAPTTTVNDSDADGKPNASGTAEPGSTITVTWPDGTTSTALADASGNWAVESPTVQTSGTITTKATDAAGNVSATTTTPYTDSTAPAAPTTTVNDADADGKPNASGTAEPGSTVTVTWPDGTTSTTTANASGNWSVESPTVQTSGTITTQATDAAGNLSATTTTAYTDSTAPAAPTTTVNDSDADGKPNASGTAEPGSTVTVTWPDGSTSTALADASGNWAVESPTVQTSGTITAKATDAAGNISAITSTPYTDSTAPAAPTTTINDSDANGKPNASGTAEPGSTVTVTWPDGTTSTAVADSAGAWAVESPTVQTSGSITTKATDAAGNVSATTTTPYTDSTAPAAPTTTVNDSDADGKPNASGTAEPGSTVTVTWPDGTTSTTTANASGNWSVESPTVQTSGTITTKATDAAGNVSATTTTPYTDSTAPAAPTTTVNDSDADGKPNASGTAEPGSTVTVTWPDGTTSTAVADSAGAWAVESPTVQTSGSITTKATDAAGNVSATTTTPYTDSTAPAAPTTTVNDSDADGKPNASGTAEPGSTVTVTWPDGTTSTTTANASGNWSVESPTVQTSGTITTQATDAAGNLSATTTTAYTDSTAPAAPTTTVNDSDADGKPNASGTAEPGSTVTVTWPDGTTSTTTANASGNWSVESPTVQTSGTITTQATDAAGNLSATTTTAYTDSTAPAAPTTTVNDSDADGKPNASGTAEPGSTVTVTWPDGSTSTALADASGNWAVESPTVQTSGTITAKATDAAGNAGPVTSTPYTDSTAPAAPTTTVNDSDANGKPNASGTAEPGSTVTVTWPDGTSSTTTANAIGNWSVESPTVQTSGTITTKATDAAGNVSATTTTPYTDNTAPLSPSATATDPDADGKPNLAGTAEAGSTVTITWPDGSTSTTTADASGNWSVESPTVQTSGNISLSATDTAGNTSSPATVVYTDSIPPAAPTLTTNDADADGKINASGTGEPGSTITVVWPDGSTSTTTVGLGGSWAIESPTIQSNGTVSATASDAAGNASAPATVTYTDTTAPATPTGSVNDADVDGKPNASGTAEPGSTVTVTWPDGSTSTTTANASGNWSVEATTVQANGSVTVQSADAAGNTASLSLTYTDTTAPAAPTLTANDGDSDGKPNVTGTAEPGSTINITWPDGSTSTVVADSAGNWVVEASAIQTSGNISVTSTDINGNTSAATNYAYTDTTAPAAPSFTLDDSDNDSKPTASGSAEPGSTVTVTWPDGSTSTTTANAAGSWSIESPTAQANGNISVTARDSAGNTSPATTASWTDSTAPLAPSATLNDADSDNKPNASGSAEPGSTITITWPDGSTSTTTANAAGNWSAEASTVQTSGTVRITATDPAGNVSPALVLSYSDTTVPNAPVISSTNDADADGKPTVSGTAEPNSTLSITWPNGSTSTVVADSAGNWSIESPSIQTSGSISVRATDAAGNTSPITTTTYTDSTPPATPTLIVNDPDADGKPNASGTTEPGASVTVTWPDGSTSTVVADSAGNWAVESPTLQGSGNISATATDAAGNPSPSTTVAYADTTPPAAPVVSVSDLNADDKPTASGTAEPNSTITVTWPDGSTSTTTANAAGSWSIESPTAQNSGNVSVSASDAAGNVSLISTAVYTDTTAPTAPSIAPDLIAASDTGSSSTDNITNDTTPSFSIAAPSAGTTPKLYVNGVAVAATYDPLSGTLTPDAPLPAGAHSITTRLMDAAGNLSAASPALSLTLDTSAPAAPAAPDLLAASDSGSSNTDNITNDSTPSFTIVPEAGGSATLYVDGVAVAATLVGSTLTATNALSNGNHVITYTVSDAAGNVSAQSASLTVTIDTAASAVPSISAIPENNAGGNTSTEQGDGSVFNVAIPADAKAGDTLNLSIGGQPHSYVLTSADLGNTITITVPSSILTALGNTGTHPVTASITDIAGNVSPTSGVFNLVLTNVALTSPTIASVPENTSGGINAVEAANGTDIIVNIDGAFSGAGTVQVGDTLRVTLNGVTVDTVLTADNGNITVNFSAAQLPASDGSYNATAVILASGSGLAGNVSPAFPIIIDRTAPNTPSVAPDLNAASDTGTSSTDNLTNQLTPAFSIPAPGAGETPKLYVDGILTPATYDAGSGLLTPTASIGGGAHTISYALVDVAGNQSGQSPALSITIDVSTPAAPTAPDLTASTDSGSSNSDNLTNNLYPSFIIAAPASGEVPKLYVDGVLVASTFNAATNTLTASTPLSGGAHNITTTLTSAAGNESAQSTPLVVTIDNAAPNNMAVNIPVGPTLNAAEAAAGVAVEVTLPSNAAVGDVIVTSIDGSTPVTHTVTAANLSAGFATLTLPSSAIATAGQGPATLTTTYTDAAGNVGLNSPQVSSLSVDTIAPSAPISAPDLVSSSDSGVSNTDDLTNVASPGFTITPPAAGETPRLYVDGVLVPSSFNSATNVITPSVPLASGSHAIRTTLVDAAGNESTASPALNITIDTTAPSAPTLTIGDPDLDNKPNATGTAAPGSTITVTWPNGSTSTTTADGLGNWSIESPTVQPQGAVSATATDAAGNVSAATSSLFDALPTVSITTPITADNIVSGAEDNTLVVSGTTTNVEDGRILTLTFSDGTTTVTTTATVTGNVWTANAADISALINGSITVTANVSDSTNNPAVNSATVILDNTPPSYTASIVSYADNVSLATGNFLNGSSTNDTTPVLNGTLSSAASAGDVVNVYNSSNVLIGSVTLSAGDTTWSLALGTLTDNTYTYYAVVSDSLGNAGSASANFSLTVDTVAPTITLTINNIDTDTLSTSAVSLVENTDFITRDTLLRISGTLSVAKAGSDILQITSDGGLTWNTVSDFPSTTTWRYDDTTPHTSNTTYQVRLLDAAGNPSPSSPTQLVTIDTLKPIAGVFAPVLQVADDTGVLGDNTTTDTNITFTSTDSGNKESSASIALINDINRNGVYEQGLDTVLATYTTAGTSWSLSVATLTAGSTYNLGFVQYDTAGNYSRLSPTTQINVVSANNVTTGSFTFSDGAATVAYANGGIATGIDRNGALQFSVRNDIATQTSSTAASVSTLPTHVYLGLPISTTYTSSTIVDYNRDGYTDVLASDFYYVAPGSLQIWTGGASGYTSSRFDTSVTNSLGAVLAYDKNGDGFMDFVLGDWGADNAGFVYNNAGTLQVDGTSARAGLAGITLDRSISGVDIDNNGTIDIAAHTNESSASSNDYALTILKNTGAATNNSSTALSINQTIADAFDNLNDDATNATGMTWGDFNNDGYMDLWMPQGNSTDNGLTGHSDDRARLYYNQGDGTLAAAKVVNSTNFNAVNVLSVDWNHDGNMDVIEAAAGDTLNGAIKLYTNNGSGSSWTTTDLITGVGAATYNAGFVASDVDWDGDMDLVYNVNNAIASSTNQLLNTNQVSNGTSLNLRILDQNGINSYFGNTVQLFNSSGVLVGTQILNPQGGTNANDNSGIVHFYNLSAAETYSVALLRNVNGSSADIAGQATYSAGASTLSTVENVNTTWTGLTTGKANSAYVLTGESNSANNNARVVGSGYNDTFFGTLGNDTFVGGGGTASPLLASTSWTSTGGLDIVDYKLASSGIVADLGSGTASGQGSDSLVDIEGLRGSTLADTFIDSSANNVFEGRGGNDIITLSGGGRDTLVWQMLNSTNATGGNGTDTINNFGLGKLSSVANADILDLRDLLRNYNGTANVFQDLVTGKYVLDEASSGLNQYLRISTSGGNTLVEVDINGTGSFTPLATLSGVTTTLADLLGNNQLWLAASNTDTVASYITVNKLTTYDTTPIVNGKIPAPLPIDAIVKVTINGVTYSSEISDQVVIDPLNQTWYVQVPTALAAGTYNVTAAAFAADGSILRQDPTVSELTIATASNFSATADTPTTAVYTAGMSDGIDHNGNLVLSVRNSVITQTSQSGGNTVNNTITAGGDTISNTTLVDYNRDGYLDVYAAGFAYGDLAQQLWTGSSGGTYTASRVDVGEATSLGGVIAYDKEGDGYLDAEFGDWGDDSHGAWKNTAGTLSTNYISSYGAFTTNYLDTDRSISGIDLNNDGDIDIVSHTTHVRNSSFALLTDNDYALTAFINNGSGSFTFGQSVDNVFNNLFDNAYDAVSMTWADFDNDGDADLYLNRTYGSDASGWFRNNGGTIASTKVAITADTVAGGASVAVDWDRDGDMDVIELSNESIASGNINLYTNNGSATWTSTSLASGIANISGANAVDVDWDGDIDLVYSQVNGNVSTLINTNSVDPTSCLHLRIVDQNGINSYFGNIVQLFDAQGKLVASQVINQQGGVGSNDSTGIISFFNLSANETYSVALIRNVAGSSADVGGQSSYTSSSASSLSTVENVNTTWGNLKASEATSAYVLSGESGTASNNGRFAGTGYNDTFFGTLGNDTFVGGGGRISGSGIWSANGGLDIVDYRLAGSSITANLATGVATGQGSDSFSGIEGLRGSNNADAFTDNSADNWFDGRAGNDSYTLSGGGHDSVAFTLINTANATGGNGADTISGFTVGTFEGTDNTDRIVLTDLLKGYVADANGAAHYLSGVATLDAGDTITNYLSVSNSGGNTVISIDRDGTGSSFSSTALVTLNGVTTDLATLLANHQLVVSPSYLTVNRQSTSDTTPIVSGGLPYTPSGTDVLKVTINGVTYRSDVLDQVVIEPTNNTWYVQVPTALAVGSYSVTTELVTSGGQSLMTDQSSNELTISATSNFSATADTPVTAVYTAGMGNGIDHNGNLVFSVRNSVITQSGSGAGITINNDITSASDTLTNTTLVDYNRDGYLDVYAAGANWGDSAQQLWTGNSSGTYTASRVDVGETTSLGGVIAYDKEGDGYLDAEFGDWGNDSHGAWKNTAGTLSANNLSSYAAFYNGYLDTDRSISGIDLNNDGDIDLASHTTHVRDSSFTLLTDNDYALTTFINNGSGSFTYGRSLDNVFNNINDNAYDAVSMTWADFDNDGDADLYLNRTYSSDASGWYRNNGGAIDSKKINVTADTLAGGASVAVDWDRDGDMDVIELSNESIASGNINLYTNNRNASSWSSSSLASGIANITGANAVDVDWDGDIDLVYSQVNGNVTTLVNNNSVGAATSLHLRIVDQNGVNSYFGNIVQLFDSQGNFVASQVLNQQGGVGSNDSTGIINFFNLSASESYSTVLIRNVAGSSADVGGQSSYASSSASSLSTVENVNTTWGNLKTGDATSAYVLSGESGTASNNGRFAGTGYNDTFFGTLGNDTFVGGGGSIAGAGAWSATGGLDIVDYTLSASAITANLATGLATGQGSDVLSDIEGLRGSSGADVFTDNSADNWFDGRAGTDTYNLSGGGHDTLAFNLVTANNATGGNGADTVNSFTLGTFEGTSNSDRIVLTDLLNGYAADNNGAAHYLNGVATLDAGETITNYLSVSTSGGNTVISIDRDGTGSTFSSTALVTLNGVSTDLATLLANHQLVVNNSNITVHRQSTYDGTPVVTGTLPYTPASGDVLKVTINGITYRSDVTDQVVIDPINKTWYVQVSTGIPAGSHNVTTELINSSGQTLLTDATSSELTVLSSSAFSSVADTPATAAYTNGMSSGFDHNGNLIFSVRNSILTQTASNTASATTNDISASPDTITNTTLVDYNRDGYMDVFAIGQYYTDGKQQLWTGSANGYTASRVDVGEWTGLGAAVAYDKEGDGYLDAEFGDNGADSHGAWKNTAGVLAANNVSYTNFTASYVDTYSAMSAIDLNNDGDIDIAAHITELRNSAFSLLSSNDKALVTFINNGSGVFGFGQSNSDIFNNTNGNAYDQVSMTWADFDNDGDADLYLNRNNSGNASTWYANSGGTISSTATTMASDTLAGGASVAVDWDRDGDMDVIELGNENLTSTSINLYTNSSNGSSWSSSTLASGLSGLTGASAVDVDWDGDIDLVYSQANGNVSTVVNTNSVPSGTSLHLRILDAGGVNSFFGNTVQLFNSSGALVATQILNPQGGIGSNDSLGLVNFYNLSSSETYSVSLIRTTSGASNDVGGFASYSGTGVGSTLGTVENVSSTWKNITTGSNSSARILSAEANGASNNGNFSGTGYNDTFFGTNGNDTFSGGGGRDRDNIWEADGGRDLVDYTLSSTGITANLATGLATGQGNDVFNGIEGLRGSALADTFTDNLADNFLEGRGGNDSFILSGGGHDQLVYKTITGSDATGGNGSDTVSNFTVGTWEGTNNADQIQLNQLLIGYTPDSNGAAHYINGVATLDVGDTIADYLSVSNSGGNTIISIDRDGTGGTHTSTTFITLTGVTTDLATLLANHQISVL